MTFEILAVTNRLLCPGGKDVYLYQIEKIAACGINGLILREKDLSLEDYESLARDVSVICAEKNVRFIVHNHTQAALNLCCSYFHLPWSLFKESFINSSRRGAEAQRRMEIGVSVHSKEEALIALEHGASWLIAGHVFQTKSKEGLESRGLEFLAGICELSPVPVYGIGGIKEDNIVLVAKTGAAGVCLMSSLMQNPDPSVLIKKLRGSL